MVEIWKDQEHNTHTHTHTHVGGHLQTEKVTPERHPDTKKEKDGV